MERRARYPQLYGGMNDPTDFDVASRFYLLSVLVSVTVVFALLLAYFSNVWTHDHTAYITKLSKSAHVSSGLYEPQGKQKSPRRTECSFFLLVTKPPIFFKNCDNHLSESIINGSPPSFTCSFSSFSTH